jgi:hypothetical protein
MAAQQSTSSPLPKLVAERIGRMFNLLFNRVSMYHLDHPSTQEAIYRLGEALKEGQKHIDQVAVILDREIITVEDEPLDSRVNAQRLVAHMQKAGIQSISFDKGVMDQELVGFARVFCDSKTHTNAEEMKKGLAEQWVQRVRINHVFFRKVTEDESVVDTAGGSLVSTGGFTNVLINSSAEIGAAPDNAESWAAKLPENTEIFQDLSEFLKLSLLMDDPTAVSEKLLQADEDSQDSDESGAGGETLLHGIRHLRSQLEHVGTETQAEKSLEKMVGAVFQLREEIFKGLEKKKEKGDLQVGEELIRQEMDDLADDVLVQLIREEYKKGEISVKRLAQIIRRMLPDIRDLRRLLPQIKAGLLAEVTPLSDYLQLIRELERELQSEEVAIILEEGADEIGLAVEDLIREIRKDPRVAAELIVLAAEVRSLGPNSDENILSQILVDYVEQLGGELALEKAQKEGPEGVHRIHEIVSQIKEEFITHLRDRLDNGALVEQVQKEVVKRQEQNLVHLQKEWVLRNFLDNTQQRLKPEAVVDAVKKAYPDPEQHSEILTWVMEAMEAQGVDPGPLKATLEMRGRVERVDEDPLKPPRGTLPRNMILFILQEEMKRARSFDYLFSAIELSVKNATTLRPVPIGFVRPHEIRNALMEHARELLRDVDLLGCIEEQTALILLPFTNAEEAESISQKVFDRLNGATLLVRDVPVRVKLAVVNETYDKEKNPHVKSLLINLERKLAEAIKP